jgi:membrane fusion protein, multidrug efflux system
MKITAGRILALIMVIVVVVWMMIGNPEAATSEPIEIKTTEIRSVQFRQMKGELFQPKLKLTGKTQAEKKVHVAAEVSGKIAKVFFNKGDRVKAGDIIARIDLNDLNAQFLSAKASEKQAKFELEATQQLVKKGLQKQTQLAAAQANYERAKAQTVSLNIRLKNIDIKAPFGGILNSVEVELGSFINVGQSIGEIISFNPIMISAQVSENDILAVSQGMKATAKLLDGRQLSGEISYISKLANNQTRTFQVEVSAENTVNAGEGLTTTLTLFKQGVIAHFFSPAFLTLDNAGDLGVKLVNEDNLVEFVKVKIISSNPDGVWVSGLPESFKLIVVGQGFVAAGDTVSPAAEITKSQSKSNTDADEQTDNQSNSQEEK